jgi:hypothetical protein
MSNFWHDFKAGMLARNAQNGKTQAEHWNELNGWISLGLLKLAIDPGAKLFIVTGAGHDFRA